MVKMTCMDADGRLYQREVPIPVVAEPEEKTTTLIGLDLGQRQDYTALAGVERQQLGSEPATYAVRRMRRWREVPYTAIRDELVGRLAAWGLTQDDALILDATGVGVAVTDLFTDPRSCAAPTRLSAITITAGNDALRVRGGWHVPKRDLVSAVAVLLEQRRLQVADGLPEAAILRAELGNFRTKISKAGFDSYGAWREGDHDDLVLAVALACWFGEHGGGTPAYVF